MQQLVTHPQRFLGVHWAEPAYATRLLEITCGEKTRLDYAEWIFDLAHYWAKSQPYCEKDIRGFITNRLMYSVYREIFSLVEKKCISIEEVPSVIQYMVDANARGTQNLKGLPRNIGISFKIME